MLAILSDVNYITQEEEVLVPLFQEKAAGVFHFCNLPSAKEFLWTEWEHFAFRHVNRKIVVSVWILTETNIFGLEDVRRRVKCQKLDAFFHFVRILKYYVKVNEYLSALNIHAREQTSHAEKWESESVAFLVKN